MSERVAQLLGEWREDAALCWRELSPRNPLREAQERVVQAGTRPGARVSARGPRGWGKTTALAAAGLYFLATRPRALVFAVTSAERQTRSLFAEVQSLYLGSRLREVFPAWRVGVSSIETGDPGSRFVCASSDSPGLLEGLHGERVLLLIDEGKSLGDEFFNSALGTLAGAKETAVLAVGTAGPARGWFYRTFTDSRWQSFTFTEKDSPHLADAIAETRERLGDRDPFFRMQYGAEFLAEKDSAALYDLAGIEAATDFDPHAEEDFPYPSFKTRSLGVDPARSGDATMLAFWHGRQLRELRELPSEDLMSQAGRIVAEVERFHPSTVAVDATGLGMGLCDRLAEVFDERNARLLHSPQNRVAVLPFVAGSSATSAGAERFYNLKSEVAWQFRVMLQERRIGFPKAVAERLTPEMLAERLEVRSDGRLKVTDPPGRSPDALDACLIGLWANGEGASPPFVTLTRDEATRRGIF